MKKKFFNAARRGSKRMKGISREVRVLDLHAACGISKDAIGTLMVMANPHKHANLFYKVCNCLRGFDAHLQGVIVEALALYYTGEAYTITSIEHVNKLLINLYRECDQISMSKPSLLLGQCGWFWCPRTDALAVGEKNHYIAQKNRNKNK